MENNIKNTLKFTKSVRNKVDEMLEIALITNPYNKEFKRLVEYRNERIMKEFKTGKVTEMLHFDNAIESVEPFNQEEEPNYDNIQSTDEFIGTQPERQSPTELETVRETPENEMEANLDGNWKMGTLIKTTVGGCVQATDGPQKRVKKRCIVDFMPPNFRLLSQDDETNESPQDDEMDELNRVVGNAVAHSLQEVKMIVGRKESPVTRSMDARMEKAKNDRNNKPKRSKKIYSLKR
ncbi:hypothetical protein Tco_1433417 [Tanacetum coccineum]